MYFISHFKDERIQTVKEHSINVAKLASEYAKKINFKKTGFLLGYFHDFGKFNTKFQDYILKVKELTENNKEDEILNLPKVDHGKVGAIFLYFYIYENFINIIADKKEKLIWKYFAEICAMIIAYHHGGLEDFVRTDGSYTSPLLERMSDSIDDEDYKSAINNSKDFIDFDLDTLIKDSYNEFYLFFNKFILENNYKYYLYYLILFLYSSLIDADRSDTLCFSDNIEYKDIQKTIDIDVLLEKFNSFMNNLRLTQPKTKINILRNQIFDECVASSHKSGIYTLTVPTGGGKTLSSLAFALNNIKINNKNRVVFNIPYTSIIEQNAGVFKNIVGDKNILEYHGSVLNDTKKVLELAEVKDFYKIITHTWDFPIIVTTFVQFFNTFFSTGTQNIRRLHSLSNSVIIFDEVQTIPIKCIGVFCQFCNFLKEVCNSTIILCTATQPELDKIHFENINELPKTFNLLLDGEIISDPEKYYKEFKRVNIVNKIKKGGYSDDDIKELLKEAYSVSHSFLTVVNTKKEAEKLFDMVLDLYPSNKCYVLTTNMCPAHRKKVIAEIKNKLKNHEDVICISTQLLEAGVDISFPLALRASAGADSVAQTSGRCNREGENESAETWIFNFKDEKLGSLKEIKNGKEIVEDMLVVDSEIDLLAIGTMEKYYKRAHSKYNNEILYPLNLDIKVDESICKQTNISKTFAKKIALSKKAPMVNTFCFRKINENFNYIEKNTYSVVVPYEHGKKIIENLTSNKHIKDMLADMKELQQYSVNIFENVFTKLYDNGIIKMTEIEGIYVLSEDYYDNIKGFQEDPELGTLIF